MDPHAIEPKPPAQDLFRNLVPLLAMLAGVSVWLWPIAIGGQMVVGGDATGFASGLMATLSRAIHERRIPLWNDLWGFGFPGLAESQMGFYYPPHLLLYGGLSLEAASAASLALHTSFAALGAYWAARVFGASRTGAGLAGFAWSCSGMFLIHLPHTWAATTGAWMPWAWGLSAKILRGEIDPRRGPAILALVLTMQILPGHFQFSFVTQVTILIMAVLPRFGDEKGRFRRSASVILAVVAVLPLAALQLLPTVVLAGQARSQRTYDYLSAFPASPVHLVNYVAPGLFHRSPLWRSVAWDPFHAMPEEHLPYLGLVPLMLAIGASIRGWRRDPSIRTLTLLAIASVLFSLGPYVPGFSLLIRLPGFSFFRAPARWGLAADLGLALLAARGLDDLLSARAVRRFAVVALIVPVLAVGLVELAFQSTEGTGLPGVRAAFETALKARPWNDGLDFKRVMALSRREPTDPIVITGLIRSGVEPRALGRITLAGERYRIYSRELFEPGMIAVALLLLSPLIGKGGARARWPLIIITGIDLLLLGRHRSIETAPIRKMTEQSPTLARLAALPSGSRSIDGLSNLPMVTGVAPLLAYRTLDRPVATSLVTLAASPPDFYRDESPSRAAFRAVGASVRVYDPFESSGGTGQAIDDPSLSRWVHGIKPAKTAEERRFEVFRLVEPEGGGVRAWFLPASEYRAEPPIASDLPAQILDVIGRSRPSLYRSRNPEEFEAECSADGAGLLIVSVLDDPEWAVSLEGPDGRTRVEPIGVFRSPTGGGAWQAVAIPGSGRWVARWSYRGVAAWRGLGISAVAWIAWGLWMVLGSRRGGKSSPAKREQAVIAV